MLQIAHLVTAGANRAIGRSDRRARPRSQVLIFERGFRTGLDVILAALDLVDDRRVILAGDACLEVQEARWR